MLLLILTCNAIQGARITVVCRYVPVRVKNGTALLPFISESKTLDRANAARQPCVNISFKVKPVPCNIQMIIFQMPKSYQIQCFLVDTQVKFFIIVKDCLTCDRTL